MIFKVRFFYGDSLIYGYKVYKVEFATLSVTVNYINFIFRLNITLTFSIVNFTNFVFWD